MQAATDIAFKEWAIVADALGSGEQILILRKGGIHEAGGEFRVDHNQFWLLPTQFHEAEAAVISAKHPRLRELTNTGTHDQVRIEYFGVVDRVLRLGHVDQIDRLTGTHIWTQTILRERFAFGREPGLYALLMRVYRHPMPVTIRWRESYGGCKSWIQLDAPVAATNLIPVLPESEFNQQRDQLVARLATPPNHLKPL